MRKFCWLSAEHVFSKEWAKGHSVRRRKGLKTLGGLTGASAVTGLSGSRPKTVKPVRIKNVA